MVIIQEKTYSRIMMMTTPYAASIFLLVSLILFVSSTSSDVASSSDLQMWVSRRRMTANENVRMTGTGNSHVDSDVDDDDDAHGNDDLNDDDTTDDHPIPTADEIFRCTERGSTGTPIYPLCPEGFPEGDDDDDAGDDDDDDDDDVDVGDDVVMADDDYASHDISDDAISYDKDCEAIRSGSEISAREYMYQLTYQIDLALEIDGDIEETLARLEDFLQMKIATDLAGCNANTGSTNHSDVDLQYVLFDVSEDTESKPYCDNCTNADVSADVRYNDGVDDTLIGDAIYDAFIARCSEMKNIEGVVDTFDPCPTIVVSAESSGDGGAIVETEPPIIDDGGVPIPDDDGTNSTGVAPVLEQDQKSSSNDKDLTGAGIFGIVMLFLVLLAFLVFFMHRRRRRNYDRRRLAKLGQNDTFMIDDANNSPNSPGRFSDGDDSMIDSRYGMYPEGQTEGMILGSRQMNQDVHKCSSATCNLCESRRQANISFLPATNAGILGIRPLQIPVDASPSTVDNAKTTSRTYGVDDTVVL